MTKTFKQYLNESKKLSWNGNPNIGWWQDNNPVTFYHGTHESRLDNVMKKGILAPTAGSTKGYVSLALEPNTAHGYASMSGETAFRAAGAKAKSIPDNERIVFVINMPLKLVLKLMEPMRGGVAKYKNKLTDRKLYDNHNGPDQLYYMITELRFKNKIPAKYITGYMRKK